MSNVTYGHRRHFEPSVWKWENSDLITRSWIICDSPTFDIPIRNKIVNMKYEPKTNTSRVFSVSHFSKTEKKFSTSLAPLNWKFHLGHSVCRRRQYLLGSDCQTSTGSTNYHPRRRAERIPRCSRTRSRTSSHGGRPSRSWKSRRTVQGTNKSFAN